LTPIRVENMSLVRIFSSFSCEVVVMGVHPGLLAVACALLPLTSPAAGEAVPCPTLKAGSWFRYAKTDVYDRATEQLSKIEGIDGDRMHGINEDGLPVVTDMIGNPYNVGERRADPKFYRLPECPFSLGETRVYRDVAYDGFGRGVRERGTFTVTVDPGFISLSVKAGTFKVVRVVAEVDYGLGWARTESFYAPEIGAVVKKEFHEPHPLREFSLSK